MADLTLWHVPLSRSMRILWLLEEIGCAYDLVQMDMTDGSMRRHLMTPSIRPGACLRCAMAM